MTLRYLPPAVRIMLSYSRVFPEPIGLLYHGGAHIKSKVNKVPDDALRRLLISVGNKLTFRMIRRIRRI